MSSDNRIIIFDTTLRDGEQALPQSLSARQKLQIALALEELGVDVLEAGFPISSKGDFESVSQIAATLKKTIPCGLSRCVAKDIEAAGEALRVAERFRIHTFIATSTIHVRDKLRKSFDDIVEMAKASVKLARNYTDDVEFSCEDAGRTSIDELCRMVEAAIDAGATTINIPDTVGYTLPTEFGGIITNIFNRVPNIDKAVLSVHCHNDLGMATANSLTAVQMGARQIECCMNGLGERAGNTALEEVVMAIKMHGDELDAHTDIVTQELTRASHLVSRITGMNVQANKAIVGANAFAHSSGIHQDGVLKNRQTYEILTPESVGFKGNNMRMTARSGRHMIRTCLQNLGYTEKDYDLDDIYARFLKLADKKGQVFDYDLESLVFFTKQGVNDDDTYRLDRLNVMSGSGDMTATATVRLQVGKRTRTDSSIGNGPVDAVYNCITRLTGVRCKLTSFEITANGAGMDALGQVNITVDYNGRVFHGMGLSTDVIESAALALLHAINNIERTKRIQELREPPKKIDDLVAEHKA